MNNSMSWAVLLLVLLAILVLMVLYLMNLQRALQALDADCRSISPGSVWLLLVPVLNLVWIFVVVRSLQKGYCKMSAAGRLRQPSGGGGSIGMAYAVCLILSRIPMLGVVFGLLALLLWMGHWYEVNKARRSVLSAWGASPVAGALPAAASPG